MADLRSHAAYDNVCNHHVSAGWRVRHLHHQLGQATDARLRRRRWHLGPQCAVPRPLGRRCAHVRVRTRRLNVEELVGDGVGCSRNVDHDVHGLSTGHGGLAGCSSHSIAGAGAASQVGPSMLAVVSGAVSHAGAHRRTRVPAAATHPASTPVDWYSVTLCVTPAASSDGVWTRKVSPPPLMPAP